MSVSGRRSFTAQKVALDLLQHVSALEYVAQPCWFYDATQCCNIWGNRAAKEIFGVDEDGFKVAQTDKLVQLPAQQQNSWKALNDRLKTEVQEQGCEVVIQFGDKAYPLPGCPGTLNCPACKSLSFHFQPVFAMFQGKVANICMVQPHTHVEENQLRMVEMCNNHPMFQFLFDEDGKLLTANQRALDNMREHLKGRCQDFSFLTYLSFGECDEDTCVEDIYNEAMTAIFKEDKPCHRFSQMRRSRRTKDKFRWVLYEMWPQVDPVTKRRAVLVCEQNISQVKALEESIRRQNKRLEAQLEEALAQRNPHHQPAIDIDTPADKTLKLLDKLMRGHEVSAREAMELRDAILQSGDLRQPMNLKEQLMHNEMDNEVSQSLLQLLSTHPRGAPKASDSSRSLLLGARVRSKRDLPQLMNGVNTEDEGQDQHDVEAHDGDSVNELMILAKEVPDKLNSVLDKVKDWQFDAFQLNEHSGGRPLSLLAYMLMKKGGLVSKYHMDDHKLVKFLLKIEDGYANNPYHNRIHAADVLRSVHVLVMKGGLIGNSEADDMCLLACYLSAVVHDYEHKGVNNDWLVRMSDPLAILYNDKSPMENHHLAAAFKLLKSSDYNFMSKVPAATRDKLRKQVIEQVLATDMKQHFSIQSTFQSKFIGTRQSNGSGSKSGRASQHNSESIAPQKCDFSLLNEDDKSLVLQMALKCADLGHLASPQRVHKTWVQLLEEEFFRQGDSEKANDIVVSPLMDRSKNGITKSQVGFFDIVAMPLFQSFSHAFPDASPMLEAVRDNYNMWKDEVLKCNGN